MPMDVNKMALSKKAKVIRDHNIKLLNSAKTDAELIVAITLIAIAHDLNMKKAVRLV